MSATHRHFGSEEDAMEFRAVRRGLWDHRIECDEEGRWHLQDPAEDSAVSVCLCGAPACPGCGACSEGSICVAQGHPCRCKRTRALEACDCRFKGSHYGVMHDETCAYWRVLDAA